MTYKGDPIAEKLDKLAEKTGVQRLQPKFGTADPFRFRVLPIVLLALVITGLTVQIGWPQWRSLGVTGPAFWIVMVAWFVTVMAYGFGPLWQFWQSSWSGKLDEREEAVIRHGHFVGLFWALCVAVLGSFTIMFGKMGVMLHMWRLWAPETGFDWMIIALFLLVVEANVAALAASAATPEPLDDGEE